MRGTLFTTDAGTSIKGIIPAHAGNTLTDMIAGFLAGGSSPRMRGTPFAPPTPVDTTGIIPAHAGNT